MRIYDIIKKIGPVTQLGEYLNGIQEVACSIHVRSTKWFWENIIKTRFRPESEFLLCRWFAKINSKTKLIKVDIKLNVHL